MSTEAVYRWDHLRLEDVHSWVVLVDALALADDTEEHYGPEELSEELQEHGLDPERDTFAVWDGDTLIAFGQVRASPTLNGEGQVRVWLSGGVHPDYRGRGIGRRLFGPTGTWRAPACKDHWGSAHITREAWEEHWSSVSSRRSTSSVALGEDGELLAYAGGDSTTRASSTSTSSAPIRALAVVGWPRRL